MKPLKRIKPRIGQRPPGLKPQVIPNKKKEVKIKHKKPSED